MRLVSKRFQDIAAQWIFKVIMLRPHPDYWKSLSELSDRPHLAKYMACLEVVTAEYLDFLEKVHQIGCTLEYRNCDGLVKARSDIGSTLAKVSEQTMSSSGVDVYKSRLKRRYEYWEDGATKIKQTVKALRDPLIDSSKLFDFGKLARLRSIIAIQNRDLVMIDTGDGIYSQCRCENAELGLRRKIGDRYRVWRKVQTANLELAVQAMMRSGNSLSSLSLHESTAMINYAPTEAQLWNLRTLILGLPYKDFTDVHFKCQGVVKGWLTDLPNLHTIKITQSSNVTDMVNIVYALRSQRYPNLKMLHLKRVVTTAAHLREFLAFHLVRLESLIIDTAVIFTPDWLVLKHEITTCSSDRCNIVLTDSFKPKPKVSPHRESKSRSLQKWWDKFQRTMNLEPIGS